MGTLTPRVATVPEATQQAEAQAGIRPPALTLALALAPIPQICRMRGGLAGLSDQDVNLKPQDRRMDGQSGGRVGGSWQAPLGHGQAGSLGTSGVDQASAFLAPLDIV